MGWLQDNYDNAIDDLIHLSRDKRSVRTVLSSIGVVFVLTVVMLLSLIPRSIGRLNDAYKKTLRSLHRDKDSVKVIFYAIGSVFFVSMLVYMFAVQYTGTNNPGNLVDCDNFSFSYAGHPTYADVETKWMNIGINGVNQTTATVVVHGASDIELIPAAPVERYPGTASRRVTRENGRDRIRTLPDETATISIDIVKDNAFGYNMFLEHNLKSNDKDAAEKVIPRNETNFKVSRRSNGQYKLTSNFSNRTRQLFGVKNKSRFSSPVTVCIKHGTGKSGCSGDVESLSYTGYVNVSTGDRMSVDIPITEISPIGKNSLFSVNITNSEGKLDVRHNPYECSYADDMNITSVNNSTTFRVVNDMVIVSGRAKSLIFRERYFHIPWTVMLKEGNFAFIIGLLSSFFTVFIQRLYTQMKK